MLYVENGQRKGISLLTPLHCGALLLTSTIQSIKGSVTLSPVPTSLN